MKIIIAGDGKVGATLTEFLSQEGHDVTVIESDPKVVSHMVNTHDVMGVTGNSANHDTLLEAGADKADLLIAATSSDEINILSCLIAKKIGVKNTIARVRNPEYAQQLVFLREELGLSMVVTPELEAAREISRLLRFPSAIKLDCFSKGRVELAEIRLPENGYLAGKQLTELYKVCKEKILVCAVQRGEEVIIPDGSFVLAAGDRIHITGSHRALASFFKAIGMFKEKSKHVLVIGGGKMAFYLAKIMADSGLDIKIIEDDEARCQELAEALPRATIIYGSGFDRETLHEEGLEASDACVALTAMDEENIVVSLYAKSVGVNKVITRIERGDFADMAENVGLDCYVSPKDITATRIVRYVRAMQNSGESNMKTLYKIVNNQAEALEFSIPQEAFYTHVPLKNLNTKKGMLIAAIIRRGRVIIPGGDSHLEAKDSIIVVASSSDRISVLEDIFN